MISQYTEREIKFSFSSHVKLVYKIQVWKRWSLLDLEPKNWTCKSERNEVLVVQ